MSGDELNTRLDAFFKSARPLVQFWCDGEHGGQARRGALSGARRLLLAVYNFEGQLVVVSDMGDFHYRLVDRSYHHAPPSTPSARHEAWKRGERIEVGRSGWRVKGFANPLVNLAGDVRWPLPVRCRDHGTATIGRADVDGAIASRIPSKTNGAGIHPSPPLAD